MSLVTRIDSLLLAVVLSVAAWVVVAAMVLASLAPLGTLIPQAPQAARAAPPPMEPGARPVALRTP
jgi:hypothetical protein